MNLRKVAVAMVALAACGSPAPRGDMPPPFQEPSAEVLREARTSFATLRDGFLEWYYEAYPVRASELGVREHDGRLPAMDRTSIQRRIDALLDWEVQLRRIPVRLMRDGDRFDHAVLEYAIRAELLDLEELRWWAVDPRVYTSLIAAGLSSLVEHDDVWPADRAAAVAARLSEAPGLLASARENLRSPSALWTEQAIEHGEGLLHWLEEELPARLAGSGPNGGAVEAERAELAAALREHMAWLRSTVLPASRGDFRMGRYLYARFLLYHEHVDMSLEELDRLNEESIATYRERLERVAAEIGPGRSVEAVLDSILSLQPAEEELVPAARALVGEARNWLVGANVVTVPTAASPVVRESPGYARQEFTSLKVAGPFAPEAAPAYYQLTLPLAGWSEGDRRSHMAYFHEGALPAVTLHETFPGRFLRAQHGRAGANALRQAFVPRSLTDGWAGYAEEVALEEGFRAGDPVVRLAQVRRALHAHALAYAVLHLHALGRPPDAVVERFMEITYLDEFPARREVARATRDPGVLSGAFGRIQIRELRRVYEAHLAEREEEQAQEFSLRDFHDRLLELSLPIPLAAEAFMPPPQEPQPGQRGVRRASPGGW